MNDYGTKERQDALERWANASLTRMLEREADNRAEAQSMEMLVSIFLAAIVVAAIFGVIG